MADKKTPNIGLTLTTDDKTLFRNWREIINGEGTEQNPSNSQIIDTEIGNIKADLINKQDKLTAGENITIDENNVISSTGGGGGSSNYNLDVQQITDYIGNQLPESLISSNPALYVNGNLSKEEVISILDKLFEDIPNNFNQYNITRTQEIDIKGCFFIFRNTSR